MLSFTFKRGAFSVSGIDRIVSGKIGKTFQRMRKRFGARSVEVRSSHGVEEKRISGKQIVSRLIAHGALGMTGRMYYGDSCAAYFQPVAVMK